MPGGCALHDALLGALRGAPCAGAIGVCVSAGGRARASGAGRWMMTCSSARRVGARPYGSTKVSDH